jgi:hypothetical protein
MPVKKDGCDEGGCPLLLPVESPSVICSVTEIVQPSVSLSSQADSTNEGRGIVPSPDGRDVLSAARYYFVAVGRGMRG